MESQELKAWMRLLEVPGLGAVAARRLLTQFGSPEAVFDASAATLRGVLNDREVQALLRPVDGLDARVQAVQDWLQADVARALLTLGDADYPQALLNTSDPPLLLYAQGQLSHLNRPAIAIVGSRHPTAQGQDSASAFAAVFAQAGWVVVSGLAAGIDAAAHEGALRDPHGAGTIAVVGTGLDRVYPASNRELAHRLVQHGVMLGEYPLGTPPLAANFPRRNRLIAGLAQGTLVVEAAVQSGSLITARLAAELGREVFAMPGSIHSPQSRGCHALIKQGAKLVETAQDVLEELKHVVTPPRVAAEQPQAAANASDDHDLVLRAMGFDPIGLDALAARTGWPLAELNAHLLELELSGQVARLPGQLFQRRGQA